MKLLQASDGTAKLEAIRAAIFVFVLLAIAEVVAPYFGVSFHDPIWLTAFLSGVLGHVINPGGGARPCVLIVKEADLCETLKKLSNAQKGGFAQIRVADSPDQAVEIIQSISPEKSGALHKLIEMLPTK